MTGDITWIFSDIETAILDAIGVLLAGGAVYKLFVNKNNQKQVSDIIRNINFYSAKFSLFIQAFL